MDPTISMKNDHQKRKCWCVDQAYSFGWFYFLECKFNFKSLSYENWSPKFKRWGITICM